MIFVTGFGKTSLKKDENYFSYDQINFSEDW